MSTTAREVVIVGGGIAGLYCSYHLAKHGWRVRLFEATERLGGRIYTWQIDKNKELWADLGAMRIEPELQVRLGRLLKDLGSRDMAGDERNAVAGDLIRFPDYSSEGKRTPQFALKNKEEAKEKTILQLFKLALRRICPRLDSVHWSRRAKQRFQGMCASATKSPYGTSEEQLFTSWVASLNDSDFDELRQSATFDGTELWKTGLWNLLSDVLDHMSVVKIRDWGTFFHIIPENPNAAEWLIVWLKGICFGSKLRTIKGGIEEVIKRLVDRLQHDTSWRGRVSIECNKKLLNLALLRNGRVQLLFEDTSERKQFRVSSGEVILALPKRPLQQLSHCLPPHVTGALDSVVGFPLIKCFFLCDVKWWEGERQPNEFAEVTPTRELWYWPNKAGSKVLVMVYTDRPGTQFWANYLPPDNTECRLRQWGRSTQPNERLERKFVKYLHDNGATDVSEDNLIDYGMIDWSQDPYGAGCHVWRPGAKSWEVRGKLRAFSLHGGRKNIHVCGEAYSDYQGFIEGALSSAEDVLKTLRVDLTRA